DRNDPGAGARALRDRLLLDPAALLGAGAALSRGLRGGQRADDAGGARRGVDGPPDRRLHHPAGGGLAPPLPGGADGAHLPRRGVVLGAGFVWYALRVQRDISDGRAAIRLFRFSISYLTLLFAAVAADSLLRLAPG